MSRKRLTLGTLMTYYQLECGCRLSSEGHKPMDADVMPPMYCYTHKGMQDVTNVYEEVVYPADGEVIETS